MSSDATEAANWIVSHMGVALDIGSDLFLPELRESVIRGWFEAPEAEALRALVQPEDVFLEIGAGSGFISSFVWSLRRASRIIAVEANPSLIPMIKSTHALNGVHAEVVNELIGAEDCNATKLHIHPNFLASSTLMESKTSVEICQSSRHDGWRNGGRRSFASTLRARSWICCPRTARLSSDWSSRFMNRSTALRESTGRFGSSPRSDSCMSPELRTAP